MKVNSVLVLLIVELARVIANDHDFCVKRKKLEKQLKRLQVEKSRPKDEDLPEYSVYNEFADIASVSGGQLTVGKEIRTSFADICKLPSELITKCKPISEEKFKEEPSIFSEFNNGRLANQMSSFASLYSLGKLTGHHIRIGLEFSQYKLLSSIFPHFVEHYEDYLVGAKYCDISCNSIRWTKMRLKNATRDQIVKKMDKVGKRFPKGEAFIFDSYLNEPAIYKDHLQELKSTQFAIDEELLSRAIAIVAKNTGESDAVIGIHARFTDYSGHLKSRNGSLAQPVFFRNALKYFQKLYKNPKFIIVSDDKTRAIKQIVGNNESGENISYAFVGTIDAAIDGKLSRMESTGIDLAILTLCDHLILTHGTFGMWAAFLGKQNRTVIMPHNLLRTTSKLTEMEETAAIKRANFENFIFMNGL